MIQYYNQLTVDMIHLSESFGKVFPEDNGDIILGCNFINVELI